MKFTPIKQTLIGFIVFLTILAISSCAEESTAPPSGPQSYMNFTLTNATGTRVTTSTSLSRGSTYGLVITRASGTTIPTADYTITHIPTAAITTNVIRTNSVDFTVNNTVDTSVTVTVTHRTNSAVSESITLNLAAQTTTSFQQDIENATTVPNFATARSPLTREVLEPLNVATGTTLEKRYVTETGGGSYNGISWGNAWAATNLRNGIDSITDASVSKVYLIMVAGGTYKPGTSRGDSFRMTNYVAIMGGFQTGGGWDRTGTTIFSGDIGTIGDATDNSYQVFNNRGIFSSAHIHGAVITSGNANGLAPQNSGGGMYNASSSLTLTRVEFINNSANNGGGGMYNHASSPILNNVVFTGNSALDGGGMVNVVLSSPVLNNTMFISNKADKGLTANGGGISSDSSTPVLNSVVFIGNSANNRGGGMHSFRDSPVLSNTVFAGNSAGDGGGMYSRSSVSAPTIAILTRIVFRGNSATSRGGGMYNQNSSPILTSVAFADNSATNDGGGMYNWTSSPVIIGTVFTGNSASNGGGMGNNNDGQSGPLIVNTIFSGNTTNVGAGNGPDIAVNRDNSGGAENIRIAGSVLGVGLSAPAQPTNAIVGYNGTAALSINYHNLDNGAVNFGADANLTANGMNFPYPTITAGSSAINLGLYVRRNGATYYFSENTTTWYSGFSTTGGLVTLATPPANAEDLTARDIAGNARNARPDAGVRELP